MYKDSTQNHPWGPNKEKQGKGVASYVATPDYTVPQCGPRKRKTRAYDGLPSFFQGFCAIGHVTSNMED